MQLDINPQKMKDREQLWKEEATVEEYLRYQLDKEIEELTRNTRDQIELFKEKVKKKRRLLAKKAITS